MSAHITGTAGTNAGSLAESFATRSLPEKASLKNLRNQAKALQKQHHGSAAEALARVARFLANAESPLKLHDAQFVIAREYGLPSWPRLVEHIERRHLAGGGHEGLAGRVRRENGRVWIEGVPRLRWGSSPEPTYIGALEAAFRSSVRPLDITALMGDSALAFRVRWATKDGGQAWCGSGPCGEWPEEVNALNAATGYVYDWDPDAPSPMPPEHRQRITEHIDRGFPILGLGARYDMAVIFGYEDGGRRILLSDYWASEEPSVMSSDDAKSVGMFLTRVEAPAPRAAAVRAGLTLAVRRWREGIVEADPITGSAHYYGDAGYEKWISDLERADALTTEQLGNLFFLNGWTYSSLYANRSGHAARYLRAGAEHLPEAARGHIESAAQAYDQMRERLGNWDTGNPMFGFVKQKKVETWAREVRQSEIALLKDVHELDARAIAAMERALAASQPTE
jgi:hypothetical protein